MRILNLKVATLALILAGSVPALASTVVDVCEGNPSLQVTVDGADPIMKICSAPTEGGQFFARFEDSATSADGELATFDGSFTADTDPFVDYVFGVKNVAAVALTFTFTYSSPYAGGPYDLIESSHVSSVTDDVSLDGVVVGTAMLPAIHNPMIDGVPSLGAHGDGCTLAPGVGSGPCDTFPLVMAPIAPTAVAGFFGITVKFTLSPGDLYSASGRFEMKKAPITTPAPGALAMLGLGLAGLGLLQRRRALAT